MTKIISSTATHANSIQKNPTTISFMTELIGRLFSSSTNMFFTALYMMTQTEPIAMNGSPILTRTMTICSNLLVASCGVLAFTFTSDSTMSSGFHPLIFDDPTLIAAASVGIAALAVKPSIENSPIIANITDNMFVTCFFMRFLLYQIKSPFLLFSFIQIKSNIQNGNYLLMMYSHLLE